MPSSKEAGPPLSMWALKVCEREGVASLEGRCDRGRACVRGSTDCKRNERTE